MIWAWRKVLFITKAAFRTSRRCYCSPSSSPSPAALRRRLTSQTVLTTLHKCPSDLTALSYFLWCARRPNYFHDKPAFRHMAGIVSNLTRTHGTVKAILQELETTVGGATVKAQTLLMLMRMYWAGDMHGMVIEAYEEMTKLGYVPNTYARNILMDVLFKIGRIDLALEVLNTTDSPNFLSHSIAVCNLCRLNEAVHLREVLRLMSAEGYHLNPNTYPLVLNCFCKSAWFSEAFQLLGKMIVLGVPLTVNTWSILIDAFCKSGCIDFAAYLLDKMLQTGCSPNVVTCTSLIKGFLESQNPEKAFEILGSLQSKGCLPDLILCNVLIDCLAKIGLYDASFEVFSTLRERNISPDAFTYSSLVSAICSSKQYYLLPLLTSGFSVQPDLVVCNCLLSYFCKSGYAKGAVQFYDDMIERGFSPDKYSFAGVLTALCRSGKMAEAIKVYRGMIRSSPFVDAHIHTIMTKGLMRSSRGGLDVAVKLFKKAASENYFKLDALSCNVVIDGLVRGDRAEEAYGVFERMKEIGVSPNKETYNLVLWGLCKDRNDGLVERVLLEMIEAKVELSFNSIRAIAFRFPRLIRAVNLVSKFEEDDDELSDVVVVSLG